MSQPIKPRRSRRRRRGEGSMFLSGAKNTEGAGLWVLQLSAQAADGKRIRKRYKYRGTEADAALALARLRLRLADGSADLSDETLRDYLIERWLPSARADIALRTFLRYDGIVRHQLVPALGNVRLSKLTAAHVDAAKQEWLRAGCAREDERKGSPLSSRSVLHILRVLHNALQRAVEWGLLNRNVVDHVKVPRPARATTRALNAKEASALLAAARGSRMFAPIVVALATGVRRGELLALRWRDFDEKIATLSVSRAVEQTRGQLLFKPPKNGRVRVLKLGGFTVAILQEHRKTQHAEIFRRRQLGLPYEQLDLIFSAETGLIWPPATFGWRFGTVVKRAAIGALRLHDLRHSSASLLIAQGIDIKRVSDRLGHSGIAITADIYGHLFVDGQKAGADAIDSVIAAAAEGR
jgi:integrase